MRASGRVTVSWFSVVISEAISTDGDRKRKLNASPCVVPKNLFFRKNCATLQVINPHGYTQICVGLLPDTENGKESLVRF